MTNAPSIMMESQLFVIVVEAGHTKIAVKEQNAKNTERGGNVFASCAHQLIHIVMIPSQAKLTLKRKALAP